MVDISQDEKYHAGLTVHSGAHTLYNLEMQIPELPGGAAQAKR
jgi:hypothetical protein